MSKKLHQKLQELEAQLGEYKNKYLHQLADAENIRKRLQKEKEETLRFAIENTLEDFLPVIDHFEHALNFAQKASPEVQSWSQGFMMLLIQFQEILQSYGVTSYTSKGNMFDPHLHHAQESVESDAVPEGTILEELSKGYKSETRVLRPAQVKVARSKVVMEQSSKEPAPSSHAQEELQQS